ncbi:hypothetical protein AMECASPLE_039757 [Ameca splendens]|uniref:Uncharacterized protein n=1 Tax=Ameca splendens TaxID=208324 RepID=A0ABV1AEZ4_9TELE
MERCSIHRPKRRQQALFEECQGSTAQVEESFKRIIISCTLKTFAFMEDYKPKKKLFKVCHKPCSGHNKSIQQICGRRCFGQIASKWNIQSTMSGDTHPEHPSPWLILMVTAPSLEMHVYIQGNPGRKPVRGCKRF